MKRLAEVVDLTGECETISMSELRHHPGEVLAMVELGKCFVIQKYGRIVAVLGPPLNAELTMQAESDGRVSYVAASRRAQ